MSPRRAIRMSLAALACSATAICATVPVHAATEGSAAVLSVAPAYPDPSAPVGKSYFVHDVAPGATWTADVTVANTNAAPIAAWVDAVDGITSIRTGAVYTARSTTPAGAGAWVIPSVSSVSLAAHTQTQISFIVRVPPGASIGDHLAGVAFQTKEPSTPSGGGSGGGGVAITTMLRSVMAIQVRVPGPAVFALHVYSATVAAVSTTGTSGIGIDMEDVGGLLGKPQLEIALDGPAGYHREQTVQLDTMLPGDRVDDQLPWPDALATGAYRLAITEDGSGRHGVAFITTAHLGASLRPLTPHAVAVTLTPVLDRSSPPIVALLVAVGAGAAMGALVLVVARRRRKHCLHCHRSFRRHQLIEVTTADDLSSCAACARVVGKADIGCLCGACLRSHLGPHFDGRLRGSSLPDRATAGAFTDCDTR
jgi:hypothetical protein